MLVAPIADVVIDDGRPGGKSVDRVDEGLVLKYATTGAGNDLERALLVISSFIRAHLCLNIVIIYNDTVFS
jgi:hypothetical protein